MRPQFIKSSIALLVFAPFVTPTVLAAEWSGSYSANGQCYCVGDVDESLSNRIVPTPIGGQTVVQVCGRVGGGPGLSHTEGLFSYPVYSDPQCGNGPFVSGVAPSDSCAGSLDGIGSGSETCQPVGPKWNIAKAFGHLGDSEVPALGAANNESQKKVASTSALLDQPVVSTESVSGAIDENGDSKPLRATVISSASAAGRTIPSKKALPPFSGRIIKIDGRRYLQAKDGVAANGGAPGSRIILDGLVFLLDNGNIAPTDLYRGSDTETEQNDAQETASELSETAADKKATKTSSAQRNVVDEKISQSTKASTTQLKPKPVLSDRSDRNAVPRNVVRSAQSSERVGRSAQVAQSRATAKDVIRLKEPKIESAEIPKLAPTLAAGDHDYNKRDFLPVRPADKSLQETVEAKTESVVKQQYSVATAVANTKDGMTAREPAINANRPNVALGAASSAVPETSASIQNSAVAVNKPANPISVVSALKLPDAVSQRDQKFSYIEASPVNYDVGGNGFVVEGSAESHSKFHYAGRVGVSNTYQELFLGAGIYLTPESADRFTVALQAGFEYGSFNIVDDLNSDLEVNYSDSGLYIGAASRLVVNRLVELRAGLGYSSFFKGDLMMFGGAYWHVNPQLDIVSRFELGDNDLLGLGVRFYY